MPQIIFFALVGVAVVITVAACTSGVDKGIRIISEMNLWVAGAMILYIIVTGKTSFLLNTMVANVGRFINTLPERTMETMGYEADGADWMGGWTLFFWAFWLAWGLIWIVRFSNPARRDAHIAYWTEKK